MTYLIRDDCIGLARFTPEDLQEWAACWQDETTQRGFNFIPPEGAEWLTEQRIERFPFWVTAVNVATGEKIGALRLSPDAMPDLAIWIYPGNRSKGWGSRAYKLACEYLFTQGYEAIYAGCFQHNVHSQHILKKCGFVHWSDNDEAETSVFDGTDMVMHGYRCVKHE